MASQLKMSQRKASGFLLCQILRINISILFLIPKKIINMFTVNNEFLKLVFNTKSIISYSLLIPDGIKEKNVVLINNIILF